MSLKSYTLLWLDANKGKEQEQLQVILKDMYSDVSICDNPHSLIVKIQNTYKAAANLVTLSSGSLFIQIHEEVMKYDNIIAVYIFCYEMSKYEQYLTHPKVKGIFKEISELLNSMLKLDVAKNIGILPEEKSAISIKTPVDYYCKSSIYRLKQSMEINCRNYPVFMSMANNIENSSIIL